MKRWIHGSTELDKWNTLTNRRGETFFRKQVGNNYAIVEDDASKGNGYLVRINSVPGMGYLSLGYKQHFDDLEEARDWADEVLEAHRNEG